ncbi:MerR family transcriptional regulator [Clostridium gasigenes]|uniref:MerR family transcriptional regulator n=1 Tax=Clostridium gasigenes TaxID=94869 RepID=UPI001C0B05EA|nr:MerR family transcriptional regulator [Clostridium gasigenes]MBU3104993.1 MerR family transcriptional regulator [Clostridium gasigenes]
MKIGEVELITGITKRNIRFYEKVELLNPNRNEDNQYRDYLEEDVKILKEIKLLRKLGISIEDISLIQKGSLTLETCMSKYVTDMSSKIKKMEQAIEICEEIKQQEKSLTELNTDEYLEKIENLESRGVTFTSIANDFITKVKGYIPEKHVMWFEPNKPITKPREFTDELIEYCLKEKKELTMYKENMMPIVMIDDVKYICILEMPRMFAFPLSIFFVGNTFGFKNVYIYKYN